MKNTTNKEIMVYSQKQVNQKMCAKAYTAKQQKLSTEITCTDYPVIPYVVSKHKTQNDA